MAQATAITVAPGDGIGPEITAATLHILKEAGARLELEEIEIGEKVYLRGISAGIEPSSWESLRRTKVFLKVPITTPQGGGFKSLNVTTRKTLGLYANVRPCVSYHPFVETNHPVMDVVIVRENEEDLYAGIEYQQSDDVVEAIKLISRPGSEKIVKYAFEYARLNNHTKVTCFTKDNIMKLSDGLFHKVFDEVSAQYPDLEKEHWIVDIGAAKLADTPEAFDVVVMPNLYGDILSDVAAQIAGSVGLAGSANIGDQCAMFEAIHGSAPRRANQNLANPSGLLLGAVMMLVHIDQSDVAERVHNAWQKTLEDGVHTYDVYDEGSSKEKVGTKEFAAAVVQRLGQKPEKRKPAAYKSAGESDIQTIKPTLPSPAQKVMLGVDISIHAPSRNSDAVAERLNAVLGQGLKLNMIDSRGVKVWPDGFPETFRADKFRCRIMAESGSLNHADIVGSLDRVAKAGLDFTKIETLCSLKGERAYMMGQGE